MAKHRILVIDDEALMREYVAETLVRGGYEVHEAGSGADGLALVDAHDFDVVMTDLKMAPMDGMAVLHVLREQVPDTRVLMMTAYGTIETAVEALKAGADDYILKPFTPDTLEIAVSRALERATLQRENRYLREEVNARFDFGHMVGNSKAMGAVYDQIAKIATSKATVLIRGETGTGKELAARAIHQASDRRDKPFIKVNCAALSAGILESELFGHERGAFTGAHERKVGRFELADGGTLLLDEVSEIGMELQPKLLRALQEREFERVGGTRPIQVDTRIIATSNRDLEQAVANHDFREDLFYRLNVIALHLPPLRQRRDDIVPLLEHFVKRYAQENGRAIDGVADATKELFRAYDWPGNVRELQNAVERAVVLADAPVLQPEHFALAGARAPGTGDGGVEVGQTVAAMEKRLILRTLEHCDNNRTRAAETLGISIRTLRNKLNEYKDA